jgi:pimeloyl-ACP methyl ester carboxylesterase
MTVFTSSDRIIVCIHGIWMMPGAFWYMQRALKADGHCVRLFGYSSVRKHPASNTASLHRFLQSLPDQHIDFIAHSLGGLLLLNYFSEYNDDRLGKCVLMGSPLTGSAVARCMSQLRFLQPFLGKSRDVLEHGIREWAAPGEVIMIAGNRNLGIGRLFGKTLPTPNDGTVAVCETMHPNLAAHYIIPASHTSMLFSKHALSIITPFLSDR